MYPTQKKHAAQVWRKAQVGPNPTERRLLTEIARRGGLIVCYREGARSVCLPDGTPVSRLGRFDFAMAIALGWLHPDPLSASLLPEIPAQRYSPAEAFIVAGEGR